MFCCNIDQVTAGGNKFMISEDKRDKTDSSQTPQSSCHKSQEGFFPTKLFSQGLSGNNVVVVHMSTKASKLINIVDSDASEEG